MRRETVGAILVVTFLVLYAFQNCAPPGSSHLSSRSPIYPSPFAAGKVILARQSFAPQETNAQAEPVLKDDINLVLTISNSCAAAQCANGANATSITCQHYVHESKAQLQSRIQYYDTAPPTAGMTASEITAWINTTPTDQACVIGVSESQSYSTGAVMFNDTYYTTQQPTLALSNFEASQAQWPTNIASVKVGIIDTGIGYDPDLEANVAARSDYRSTADQNYSGCPTVNNLNNPNNAHGTFVAGLIGAVRNNNLGVVGVAPNAKLYAYMIGNCLGKLTTTEVANAIEATITDGMEVVNMSLGAPADDPAVRDAIVQGLNASIIFVAAAGNNSADLGVSPAYPAVYSSNYQGVIAVAASDPYGNLASFSNYSSTYVNIVAPGQGVASVCLPAGGICTALSGSTYGTGQGTSFATPLVTGAVALTLGVIKSKAEAYSASGVQDLVTIQGARAVAALNPYVQNGAFLDFNQLASALGSAANVTGDQVQVTSQSITITNGVPSISVSFSWNLTNIPTGTKLGLFNISAGCNYTAPCMIQGLAFSGNSGSMTIQIPQNQVETLMADLKDPSFELPISIAFYYPIYDSTGTQKNNPGLAASTTVNLRNFDGSSQVTNPSLQGAITNVRMDMQYFYVQGWACYTGSNAMVTVGLQQYPTATPVSTYSVYTYPYMFPHSGTVDQDYPNGATSPPLAAPYMANSISVVHNSPQTTYSAGIEGNPQLIGACQTLTASHAFELIVPLWQISSANLSETSFQVVATFKGATNILKDPQGNAQFQFPDVNFQTQVQNTISLSRTPSSYTFSGSLCSSSPSPIEVEASFSSFDFKYSMFGNQVLSFGIPNGFGGFVSDPTLPYLGLEAFNYAPGSSPSLTTQPATVNPANKDTFTQAYLKYSSNYPNATINWSSFPNPLSAPYPADFTQLMAQLNSRGLTQIGTGVPVTIVWQGQATPAGPQEQVDFTTQAQSNLNVGFKFYNSLLNQPWDWYDVGEAFAQASSLVGYTYNTSKPAGLYMVQNYGVNEVLRETKKYETPLSQNDTVLGHAALTQSGTCAAGFNHNLASPLVVANYINYSPAWNLVSQGTFLPGQSLVSPVTASMQAAMQQLPLTLRFFQDGKLILHLESDTSSNFYSIKYPFQQTTY